MTDENVENVEINVPVQQPGKVNFLNKSGFNNPAPSKLKRVLSAIKYTFVSMITSVGASDLFTGKQSKIISFCLGMAVIICGFVEFATGVEPVNGSDKN